MGDSQIVKDNFVFGLTERRDVYHAKADAEDGLRNRDANKHADRRCDLWLVFENGVRLNIEMQDAREADTALLPPAALPDWLKYEAIKAVPSQAIVSVDQEAVDVPLDDEQPSIQITGGPSRKSRASVSPAAEGSLRPSSKEQPSQHGSIDQDAQPGSALEQPSKAESAQQRSPELAGRKVELEGLDMSQGAKLSFTFNEGLVV
jgi:hypothetical protein